MNNRRGRKVSPSAFTRYLETTHAQHEYGEIVVEPFQVDRDDMKARLERAIRAENPNKAVGTNGTHIEMLQVETAVCADLLTAWWTAIGRTRVFPEQWSRGTICPLLKKGLQSDPDNYRPVLLLSHIRKTVDTAVLTNINEQFTPSSSQFGFQSGITLAQALLQEEENAKGGMTLTAILDLEKAYDKVDLNLLLDVTANWLDTETIAMVRALLGPV